MIFIVAALKKSTIKRPFTRGSPKVNLCAGPLNGPRTEGEGLSSIDRDLHLPDSLRGELRKRLGKVVECSELVKQLKRQPGKKPLITVGDSVSESLIKGGISPNLIIWDGKTKRTPSSEVSVRLLRAYTPPVKVKNPAAAITQGAWAAVVEALKKEWASLFVDGEEDLLAIPVILNAEDGARVVYGLPGEGAILIVVNRKIKAVFQDMLSRFK